MTIDDAPAKFRLADAMALLAATAVGLAGLRYHFGTIRQFGDLSGPGIRALIPEYPGWSPGSLATAASLVLAAYSPALLWSDWRGIGAIARRPGLVACAAATVVAAGFLGWHLAAAWAGGWPVYDISDGSYRPRPKVVEGLDGRPLALQLDLFAIHVLPRLGRRVGPAVLLAWAGLALARRWRRPSGWADRAGVIVGFGWIAVGLLQVVSYWTQAGPFATWEGWVWGRY